MTGGLKNNSRELDNMKRMFILGLFFGTLMLFSYQPPAQAMPPAFAPSFAKVDGVVVKAYTYRRARVTGRRTARRVYRRHTYGYHY
jgi:hypothetical protein